MIFRTVTILIVFISATFLYSQEVSYMIPDIGTPGMNTYVEIIGPYDGTGNFGEDGLYMNKPGDRVRILLTNPADSTKIVIGPLVVSWNGRMISTQIFVNAGQQPNDPYWKNLNNQFIVPIRVVIDNISSKDSSKDINFYIVKPYSFGDLRSNTEKVIGEGSLGRRSPTGSMIINEVHFNSLEYTVSTNDCDDDISGNQAYFPFILLSKGKITGENGTKINVSGGKDGLKHGGPGGGGGGGKYCDAWGGDGSDGGNGFTAGGPGGRNGSGILSDKRKNPGTGTGQNGNGLNGIPRGTSTTSFESAGGGTGHPFGLSGEGCGDGNNCNPPGGYGAGSGVSQEKSGGSAGYYQNGTATSNDNNNYGRENGNVMAVPVAGGSGAASGNPQSPVACSGDGGGGGGALVLYGLEIANLELFADGAKGSNPKSSSASGGCGSGGYIGLFSKLSLSSIANSAEGGFRSDNNKGGGGRLRWDTPITNTVDKSQNTSLYKGLTTDSSSIITPRHTLTGSIESGAELHVYIRSESTDWIELTGVNINGDNWDVDLDLQGPDSLYYIAALVKVNNPLSGNYTSEPSYIFSQAAANILFVDRFPVVESDTLKELRSTNCPGEKIYDTVAVYNTGTDDLVMDFGNASFLNGVVGFNLESPITKQTIKPDDFINVIVSYSYQPGHTGTFSEILSVPHNSDKSDRNPWEIRYEVTIDEYDIESFELDLKRQLGSSLKDALHLGKVCSGDIVEKEFAVVNNSDLEINLLEPVISDPDFSAWVSGKKSIPPNDTGRIMVSYDGNNNGGFIVTGLKIKIEECEFIIDSIAVDIDLINSQIDFFGSGDFGTVAVGKSKTLQVVLKNTDAQDPVYMEDLPTLQPPFVLIGSVPSIPPPLWLLPGDSIIVTVEFTPTDESTSSELYKVFSVLNDTACVDSAEILFIGKGAKSSITADPDSLFFGVFGWCQTKKDTITVENTGNVEVAITGNASISGPDAANFRILRDPGKIVLSPGSSVEYIIEFDASIGSYGIKNASLDIPTDDVSKPTLTVPFSAVKEKINVSADPDPVDLGDIPVGYTANASFDLTNNGLIFRNINSYNASNSDLTVNPSNAYLAALGGTESFTVTVTPTIGGSNKDTLWFYTDKPCLDTVEIIVIWNGLKSDPQIDKKLDFGELAPCEPMTDSVKITNQGQAKFEILNMNITGVDDSMFTIINPVYPTVLEPGETIYQQIRFDPAGSADGLKTAQLEIDIYLNAEDSTLTVDLSGEIMTGLSINPLTLNFGDVIIGNSKVLFDTAGNNGSFDILIESISQPALNPVYTFGPDRTGEYILPGTSTNFNAVFTPDSPGSFNDSVQITFNIEGCELTSTIYLTGNGMVPSPVYVRLPDTIADPKRINFDIPVYIRGSEETVNTQAGFRGKVSFDAALFFPESVTGGVINGNILDGRTRTIDFTVDNFTITEEEKVFTYIKGDVLLGDIRKTPLDWIEAEILDNDLVSEVIADSGSLEIKICEAAGDRLIKVNFPLELIIYPNPAGNKLEVQAFLLETGHYRIQITDLNGRNFVLKEWNSGTGDKKKLKFDFDIKEFSSGFYYISIFSPNRVKVYPLMIIK